MPSTTPERSALMKRVRQKNTAPERGVRQLLHSIGAHYRTNVKSLPGSPDIANKSRKRAIFVHGCFWHGHQNCSKHRVPKANREFWEGKFRANIARDEAKLTALQELGYKTLVVWECQLKDSAGLKDEIRRFWFGDGFDSNEQKRA